MKYFVTGATGFIGKRLVKALLARPDAVVHFLVRPGSESKLAALYDHWGLADGGEGQVRRDARGRAAAARGARGEQVLQREKGDRGQPREQQRTRHQVEHGVEAH